MVNLTFRFYTFPAVIAVVMALSVIPTPAAFAQGGMIEKLIGKTAEPVSPDQAFSVKARRVDATRIALDYSVLPGYYLYRERMAIALKDTPGMRIARINFPPTVTKEDKTFGRSEVFKTSFVVTIELEGNTKAAARVMTNYQGCYEALGVCYPPESKAITIPPHS